MMSLMAAWEVNIMDAVQSISSKDHKNLGDQNLLQSLSNAQCLDLLGHSGEVYC
jgi:hypothetical protein